MITLTSDKLRVWKNKKEDGTYNFTYSISNKKMDGTYEYMTKRIEFVKGNEPSDTCDIKIRNAFQSFYSFNENKYDYIKVLDYEVLSEQSVQSISQNEIVIDDDDLPF